MPASQAGRRRFESGRPLQSREGLAGRRRALSVSAVFFDLLRLVVDPADQATQARRGLVDVVAPGGVERQLLALAVAGDDGDVVLIGVVQLTGERGKRRLRLGHSYRIGRDPELLDFP